MGPAPGVMRYRGAMRQEVSKITPPLALFPVPCCCWLSRKAGMEGLSEDHPPAHPHPVCVLGLGKGPQTSSSPTVHVLPQSQEGFQPHHPPAQLWVDCPPEGPFPVHSGREWTRGGSSGRPSIPTALGTWPEAGAPSHRGCLLASGQLQGGCPDAGGGPECHQV